MTVQGATFNMRGQLYCGHTNATAFGRMTQVLVLAGARRCALETCRKKKMQAPLLGSAKSIYYCFLHIENCAAAFLFQMKVFKYSFNSTFDMFHSSEYKLV